MVLLLQAIRQCSCGIDIQGNIRSPAYIIQLFGSVGQAISAAIL